ncbi:putative bifunctional diguanylate cyclase/phosphodiesterase [Ideonella paludis]|uniref:EAL domain-containing protein n=2 Tax=Ideonella paludis TaxID=1233411 RepID=A0ABS5DTX8_9BURK|nr:EAL domain-containing protein [Ideonella paludis]
MPKMHDLFHCSRRGRPAATSAWLAGWLACPHALAATPMAAQQGLPWTTILLLMAAAGGVGAWLSRGRRDPAAQHLSDLAPEPFASLPMAQAAPTMLDQSSQMFGWVDGDGIVLHMNRTGLLWLQSEDLLQAQMQAIWTLPGLASGEQADALKAAIDVARGGQAKRIELKLAPPQQDPRYVEIHLRAVNCGSTSTSPCVLIEGRDVTLRRQTEDKLMLAATVFEQAREGIMITDAKGEILSINQAFSDITGYSPEDAQGQYPGLLTQALERPQVHRRIRSALERKGHWQGELRSLRRNGEVFTAWVSLTRRLSADGQPTHLIGIINDITRSREAELKLHRQAHYDPLTDLPNRRLFEQRLQLAMQKRGRDAEPVSVLFMDLNQFRDINDNFGHRTGDAVLVEMAHRLREDLREADVVARLGGDEFAVCLPGAHAQAAHQVALKLQERLAQPCMIDSHELSLTASVGIAIFPDDGDSVELITRNAETAMYRAKQEGRASTCFFTEGMQPRSVRHLQLEAHLRRAIERDELLLHYQPQLDTATGRVVGLEALVRWRHPELGMVSPGEFIPLAEHNGQIVAIGEWVMRTAAQQMKSWMNQGLPPLVMAVNLSAVQFRDPTLPERVQAILNETGLPACNLELELTESVATGNPTAAIVMMDRLHALGLRLSIDDFGTGYSSLNYLKRFRIDTLKIDQSFVRDIHSDPDDRAIVQAIIQMAHALNLTTIAEGVETDEQADFLRANGCDMLQGYRFCRPIEPQAALLWLQERTAQPPLASAAAA